MNLARVVILTYILGIIDGVEWRRIGKGSFDCRNPRILTVKDMWITVPSVQS